MLETIYIKNYAIIDSLEIDWSKGMTVITGETGAGKSILIGAIQFVLGARADSKVLRNPDMKCIVEIKFGSLQNKNEQLKNLDFLDSYDEVLIRREIAPGGKSRTFVNDTPVVLADLHLLSPLLIAIHQQFDQLDILEEEAQFQILDSYAEQIEILEVYRSEYRKYKNLIKEKSKLEEFAQKASEEKDYLEFQLNELLDAKIELSEYRNLEDEINLASRSEELIKNLQGVSSLMHDERGILDLIQEVSNMLKSLHSISSIEDCNRKIQEVKLVIKEIGVELDSMAERSDFDQAKIQIIQERFDLLTRLFKKHRVQSETELLEIQEGLDKKLRTYSILDESISSKAEEILGLQKRLFEMAGMISSNRIHSSKKLPEEIVKMLKALGMENVQFDIQITDSELLNENGINRVDYLFSANKGIAPKILKNQASGGELSRLNLVLKSIMSKKMNLPTLIFDEIDTGVSGQVALQMGNILREISKDTQLICITHSPQVASRANQHYYVYKDQQSKITNTQFKKLEKQDRNIELAKMLSGDPPSASAIKNANELISSAN